MILKPFVAWLGGSVRVRVEAAFPERVLNLCAAHGVALRDPERAPDGALVFTVPRRDRRRLAELCARLGAEVRLERASGAPFLLGRVRRRRALLFGLAFCAAALVANSLFLWDVRVTGNERVPTERILRVLAAHGVRRGAFGSSFRQDALRDAVLSELPELSWLAVNVRGCRAQVSVRERVPRPALLDRTVPTNVVAAKDALVTEVRAYDGEARVLRGMTVRRGQLLISGVVDTGGTENPSVHTRFLAGKGEVYGRTWYELSTRVPLAAERRRYTGEKKAAYALLFGETRVKFGKESSNLGANCDKMIQTTRCVLPGDLALPVAWVRETYLPYEPVRVSRTRGEALAVGEAVLREHLLAQLAPGGIVLSARTSSAERDGWLLVTLSAECREQIGQELPIEVG